MKKLLASFLLFVITLLAFSGGAVAEAQPRPSQPQGDVTTEELQAIAQEAYLYLYPLVTMDLTRGQLTNIEAGKMIGRGPMNTFTHLRAYPAANFKEVVRPNFDTLYSTAWLDITQEPVIVSVPDTAGRYYLLPMLDMWSDVFAVPGKRTTGTSAGKFAVTLPNWKGRLPKDVTRIDAPTPYVWIIGRTQTNGPSDYDAVHKIQDGFGITPLSQWGRQPKTPKATIDPNIDMKTPPLAQVNTMPAEKYFSYGVELMKLNAPHLIDQPIIARMKRIGIVAGKAFEFEKAPSAVQNALKRGAEEGLKKMIAAAPTLARVVNGWQMNTETMGVYGTNYLRRACVAMVGLGANLPEDAVYPLNVADRDGRPLDGSKKYVMHFKKSELPPVNAFWSLTMYDKDGFQVANPINRFAIGGKDDLRYNEDGSLDLYIQHENPGVEKESNWLPSPATGVAAITMRLYSPRAEVLDGRWVPPAVERE